MQIRVFVSFLFQIQSHFTNIHIVLEVICHLPLKLSTSPKAAWLQDTILMDSASDFFRVEPYCNTVPICSIICSSDDIFCVEHSIYTPYSCYRKLSKSMKSTARNNPKSGVFYDAFHTEVLLIKYIYRQSEDRLWNRRNEILEFDVFFRIKACNRSSLSRWYSTDSSYT